jgi:5-amino-6-(5-phosphoribosylamino)uracil reductase
MTRPYVLLSAAISVDGYLDDSSDQRLLLSNAEDFDRVDEVRANCDAIMIGAGTIRADNPRLLVNSQARRAEREARGESAYPLKVTLTATGNLDPEAKWFHHGGAKIVYCPTSTADKIGEQFGEYATIVGIGDPIDLGALLDDLGERGIRRLMVEGGSSIHTQFLTAGLADEIHLAVAPFFVGDSQAPRFVGDGQFPNGPGRRMNVAEVRSVGDVVLIRYLPKEPKDAG